MKLPQLSLRDLFWLVLVVGMGCAWWVDRSNQASEVRLRDERWQNEVLPELFERKAAFVKLARWIEERNLGTVTPDSDGSAGFTITDANGKSEAYPVGSD